MSNTGQAFIVYTSLSWPYKIEENAPQISFFIKFFYLAFPNESKKYPSPQYFIQ